MRQKETTQQHRQGLKVRLPNLGQAPNQVRLNVEHLKPAELMDFRNRMLDRQKWRVCARLWAVHGMEWRAALKLAEDAFNV